MHIDMEQGWSRFKGSFLEWVVNEGVPNAFDDPKKKKKKVLIRTLQWWGTNVSLLQCPQSWISLTKGIQLGHQILVFGTQKHPQVKSIILFI